MKMLKPIFNYCLFLIIFVTPLSSQNAIWQGFVSYPNSVIEPNESTCDIIKNGVLHIAPTLSEQSDYWSNLTYFDTVCLARNFSLEVKLRNKALNGGLDGFDSQVNFFSNGLKTSVVLAGASSSQANTTIKIGDSTCVSNQSWLVTNLDDWRIVKLSFIDNIFTVFLDGIEIYKTRHSIKICNLDILKFAFKGGGEIDWVKLYDSTNSVFWSEDFSDCKTLAQGVICDPTRLDKSVLVSRTCQNDTLSLLANFPAMSYRWTTPSSKIDTNKLARIINPITGFYDLTANINACFDFFKTFEVFITPSISVNKTVRLCTGQTYTLFNGKILRTDGIYKDSLKTKLGCDSIVVIDLTFDASPLRKTTVSICSNTYTLPSGKIVTASGIYRDTTKDVGGCLSFFEVTLSTGSNSSLTVITKVCEGQNFTLPNGKKVNSSGTYRDTLKSISGCDSIIITQLSVILKPKIKFEISKIGELFEGDNVTIKAVSENGNYSWYENTQPLPRNGADIPIIVKGGETIYRVVLNALGCEVTDSLKVIGLSEIKMPNAFSPNSDNINDYFTIASKSEKAYKFVKFNVFNRQGKLVYDNSNSTNGWDGTYNGADLASDTYVYIIHVESPAGKSFQFKGEVLLLR